MSTVAIVALITWILTASGGFVMLATWLRKGGMRRQPRTTQLPPGLLLGHFTLAAAGLILWIIYLATATSALTWTSLIILIVVALGGFTMLAKWLPVYRAKPTTDSAAAAAEAPAPPERHFPLVVVLGHGLLGAATIILVLLAALGTH